MRRRNNANAHHAGNGANRGGQHGRNRRYSNNRGGFNAGDGQNDHANAARVRRHATAQREKYNNMARDALSSGDRVQAEYYLQHVEHFTRVLNELPAEETRQNRYYNNGPRDDFGAPQGEHAAPQDAPQPDAHAEPHHHAHDTEEEFRAPQASALPAFITGGGRRPQASSQPPAPPSED
jgi:hypothetical protein